MLIACITERARRLELPADLPMPRDRDMLEQVLAAFGTQLVREISDPTVIGAFRLAIAEAVHAPEVARTLDSIGRETSRAALRGIMAQAQTSGLLDGTGAVSAAARNGTSELCNRSKSLTEKVAIYLFIERARRSTPRHGRTRVVRWKRSTQTSVRER